MLALIAGNEDNHAATCRMHGLPLGWRCVVQAFGGRELLHDWCCF
jgi:hypothetical protein